MIIKRKIDDLEELNSLSDKAREYILREYKKGYHFLLFYGKLLVALLLEILTMFDWLSRWHGSQEWQRRESHTM